MSELHFTNKAVGDLDDIWNYTVDEWSETQADLYYNMLIESCRKIACSRGTIGKIYDDILPGLYGYKSGRHIIFYKNTSGNDILIVRILHERMDIRSRLR
ncbi:MAG: type II toxin-antitoxin system RelE/ParE family toxin [Bacteroidales bacterium]|nr:type II toxin-antitoxin system RelE/ParE family toxin [Bacteroidales bacterium]